MDDIFAMLELTGVSAVAVARGCIGNPWIFRQARELMSGGDAQPPTLMEQRQALLEHIELSLSLHGEHKASRMMRKFGIKYAKLHPEYEPVRDAFVRVKEPGQWREVLAKWYATDGPGVHPPVEEPNPLSTESTRAGREPALAG